MQRISFFLVLACFIAMLSACGDSQEGNGNGADSTVAQLPEGFWVTYELKSAKSGNVLKGANLMWDFKSDGTFEKIFDFSIIEEGTYSSDGEKLSINSKHGFTLEYLISNEADLMTLSPQSAGDSTIVTLQSLPERGPEYAPENLKKIPMQDM